MFQEIEEVKAEADTLYARQLGNGENLVNGENADTSIDLQIRADDPRLRELREARNNMREQYGLERDRFGAEQL
ncbi:MAG: hypothetical protein Q9M91_06495 [Candidatus Dojkabacteria bacterium]|nr:hypothetical protein [Candidatus Dojkabacteria bacterium]MDQ7021445.1 hypothetical protein [Candidatus Dojkabacteria bacterium]